MFVIFICIHFNHFFVVDITSGIAEMKISDWRGFSFFKYIVDFFFVLTCLSDRIPPIVTCASTATKGDVRPYLKSVSITCHKLFLDCLEIIIDDYDLELFLEPSQTVFERLGNFKNHDNHQENSRSAVIQAILQGFFFSYQESQLYWLRGHEDIAKCKPDIFLYRETDQVIFLI